MFYVILEQKNNFLRYKKKVQKVEKLTCLQRVSPRFSFKIGHFPTFVLGNIGQENVFYDILKRNKNFLGYENKN